MTKCKVIALANQKGWTAKTTTTLNLGIGLAHQGRKVLLVDADPQGDLTTALGWTDADNLPITLDTQIEYSGWFYNSCPVIWKSLFISAFCAYWIIISVETLVKTAMHRRCGKVLTNIPTEMDKSSSTKEAISEYRNSDFQFSGSAISSHKNIHKWRKYYKTNRLCIMKAFYTM